MPKLGSQSRGALSLPRGSQGGVLRDRGWVSPVRWPLWLRCRWKTAGHRSRHTRGWGRWPRSSAAPDQLHEASPLSPSPQLHMALRDAPTRQRPRGPGDSPAQVPRGRKGKEELEPPAELFAPLGGTRVPRGSGSCQHPPVPSTAHGGPAGPGGAGGHSSPGWSVAVPSPRRAEIEPWSLRGRWPVVPFVCVLPGDTWTGPGQAGEGTSGDGHVAAVAVAAGCGGRGRALLTWPRRGFAFRNGADGPRPARGWAAPAERVTRAGASPPRALGASC